MLEKPSKGQNLNEAFNLCMVKLFYLENIYFFFIRIITNVYIDTTSVKWNQRKNLKVINSFEN